MSGRERRIFGGVVAASLVVALLLGSVARGTGGAAITLLLGSLAMSPLSRVLPPAWALASRTVRRRLGIASAGVAVGHALFAFPTYLDPLVLGPITALPWLRHGFLALGILCALLVTSFPVLQRALRVKAWSSLHRLAYVAAALASLHALAVPFGSIRLGIVSLSVTALLLVARPLTWALRRRAAPDPE